MHCLNRNTVDTLVLRIITLVPIMYLPATFLSTLFSTGIIKYQNDNIKMASSQRLQWFVGSR
ncbi:hypothetical protein QBC36DRAFT_336195 [Triangularia setosa]|uniref:Uncharacterized protein n=1 Tax=Triangularia setosa TaxID=2587417 RepID=A0AAN6W1J7_9PEZI|nr:hypothetical protein QBC36DRAFT_336195 [Podospora setosa]